MILFTRSRRVFSLVPEMTALPRYSGVGWDKGLVRIA